MWFVTSQGLDYPQLLTELIQPWWIGLVL